MKILAILNAYSCMKKPSSFFPLIRFPNLLFAASLSITLFACHSHSTTEAGNLPVSADKATGEAVTRNPEYRKIVKKEPVATYQEKTDNPLNNWYFTVKIFETPKTMEYLLTMQFEEVKGQDTLDLPDFGTPPIPVLQKGKDKYSCIVGFMDNHNKFLEYKLVYVKDGNTLKLTTLKHYSVSGGGE